MGPALREDELQGRLRFLGGGRRRVGGGGGILAVLGGVFGGAGGLDWPRFVSLEVGGGGADDFGR